MSSENYSTLLNIQDNNSPSIITFTPGSKIYDVDLNTRSIEKIKTIIVETDHRAETIYFRMARFFDNMDLSKTVCIIQYENSEKQRRLYAVPYYDIESYANGDEKKGIDGPLMLVPWVVSECVTPKDGEVTFSIKFYQLDTSGTKFNYVLNTLPSLVEIQKGIGFTPEEIQTEEEYTYLETAYLDFLQNAAVSAQEGSLTWIVLN